MYCILVTGIPAAGKSTMAGYLSDYFGIPVISKDRIKELMYDDIGFHSRDEKVKLDENSFENGNYINENKDLIWNALKGTQSDIIVESRINWKTYFGRTKSRNGRKSK